MSRPKTNKGSSVSESAVIDVAGRKAIARDCPMCSHTHSDARRSKYAEEPWPLVECAACGFPYLDKAPIFEELAEDHEWYTSSAQWNEKRKQKHPLVAWLSKLTRFRLFLFKRKNIGTMLQKYLPNGGNVLEVGCGDGRQLRKLEAGYIPFGVEISRPAARAAHASSEKAGGRVVCAPATVGLAEFEAGSMDAIVMLSYLEHETDPEGVMRESGRVLKPGGVVIIKVPNYGCLNRTILGRAWSGFRFPDHLNYFTPKSLLAVARRHGLSPVSFSKFPTSDNMWLVARAGAK